IVRARPRQQEAVRNHLRRQGAVVKDHSVIGAVTARISADRLPALDRDSAIETISLDAPMRVTEPAALANWASIPGTQLAASLGLPVAGVTGRGVGIAFIDSGLAPNADFGDVDFFDFTAAGGHHAYDDYGHGTHLGGLVASNGVLSQSSDGPLYK